MIIENSKIINDLVTFCPKSFKDNRGYFSEIYQKNIYKKELKIDFVQDNTSFSKKNTIRGFHFQTNKPQGKLIFCLRGSFDLYIVDLRKKSKSYLKYQKFLISENNRLQVYLPPGCANAVFSRSKENILLYKCTEYWSPKSEKGFNFFNNNIVNINFNKKYKISVKDINLPNFDKIKGKYFKS